MPTAKEIMEDADSRYRNTFSLPKKLGWLNYAYFQLRKKMHLEDELLSAVILTVGGVPLYPFPDGVSSVNIREINLEDAPGTGSFRLVPFKAIQDEDISEYWTFFNGYFLIYPTPVDQRAIMFYFLPDSAVITEANYTSFIPDLDKAYHELLVLMLVERYAAARKDVTMKSNYANDGAMMESDLRWTEITSLPEFPSCRDVMPRRSRYNGSRVDFPSED